MHGKLSRKHYEDLLTLACKIGQKAISCFHALVKAGRDDEEIRAHLISLRGPSYCREDDTTAGRAETLHLDTEQYSWMLGRAQCISQAAVVKFCSMVATGALEGEIVSELLRLAIERAASRETLKNVDDDTFMRGLTNPSMALH